MMSTHSLLIRGVRLFDGSVSIAASDVFVKDGTIAAVGRRLEAAPEATIIEGQGKTLLPGLIDSHTHAFFREELRSAILMGVTTELDMFNDPLFVRDVKNGEAASGPLMASLYSAGTLITAPHGHGNEYGYPIPTITGPEQAEDFVEARLAEGSDYIKVIYEDGSAWGVPLPCIARETLASVIQAAHKREVTVVVHISSLEQASVAIAAGADGLAHTFEDRPADQAFVARTAERGCFVIPTLTLLENATGVPSGRSLIPDPDVAPFLAPYDVYRLEMTFIPFPGLQKIDFQHALDTTRVLHRAGVPILAGTDAGNPGTAHGASLHRELELLVKAGLTPIEALAAATSVAAKAFHLFDRGRIAAGLRADLVLVDGDPTTDIRQTRKINRVWKQGVEVPRASLAQRAAQEYAEGPTGLEAGLVDRFGEGTIATRFGFGWLPATDAIAGGRSVVHMRLAGGSENRGGLVVAGEIRPQAPHPWAGITFLPGPTPFTPANLSSKKEILFRARGDGRSYQVGFHFWDHGLHRSTQVFVAERCWRDVAFRFSDFGTNGRTVMGVFFGAGPQSGPFSFELDKVRFR